MMYSAYKLNKQGDNIQLWPTPIPIWNQSVVPCPVLTVASWPAYRFLKRQVRWSGIPIPFWIFQFIVIHTVKGFGIVNKAEIDVFLKLSCFFDHPMTNKYMICFHQCLNVLPSPRGKTWTLPREGTASEKVLMQLKLYLKLARLNFLLLNRRLKREIKFH